MTRIPEPQTDQRLAYAFLRFVFGVNIFFHGISRLFAGHGVFLNYLDQSVSHAVLIPKSALPAFAAILPWAETLIGLLLLLGLFTRFALLAGSSVMIVLMAGATLSQNWDVAGLQLIYCLVYFALLTYRERNVFSFDTLFHR